MIVLTGYTASGKDTTLKELIKLGYKPIISYTTRPIRPKEIDGVDYHFISEIEFLQKNKEGFFAETSKHKMIKRHVYYGSAEKDIENNSNGVVILDPNGLNQIKEKKLNITSFYIDVDEKILIERLKQRGDNEADYELRLENDKKDFKNIHNEVDFIIDGNNKTPKQIALEILDRANNDNDIKLTHFLNLDKPCYENVVYISHKFQNDMINVKRVEDIICKLTVTYPTYLFISPIHSFQFLYHLTDYQKGLDMCLWLLEQCDCLWAFDDYSDSVGTNGEIAFAKRHKIPYKIWSKEETYEKLGL
ncbi:AAA family ATPase [Anaerocolumna aminovalerica]|uniref:AAA family ATPase n=1 Tax=Anaerocolumna aminovalerica TaxID=1527 RepID=UPI001C0F3A09|nr:AAA family ATPase [Anaerocolumna aminovalerica]MBU5331705.1 AAA family ATPase [Anaerocolumna aminovalerica]